MKPDEPSRTALLIVRQRAAHQRLDHGSIFFSPFALMILREDEKEVLQFANKHPVASIGRLFTAAQSRVAEDALSKAEFGRSSSWAPGSTLSFLAIPIAHWISKSIKSATLRRRDVNASALPELKSHFRDRSFSPPALYSLLFPQKRASTCSSQPRRSSLDSSPAASALCTLGPSGDGSRKTLASSPWAIADPTTGSSVS